MLRLPTILLAATCLALTTAPLAAAQPATPAAAPPAPPPVYVPTSLAAEPGLPRTPDGHPDFQDAVWTANFIPILEATPMAAKLVLTEDEAKKMFDMFAGMMAKDPGIAIDPEAPDLLFHSDGLPIVRGERRSRQLVLPADGKLPMTPEAHALMKGSKAKSDNPEERPASERCLVSAGQPPVSATVSLNPRQIVQTKDHIIVHTEFGDEARIIPVTDKHREPLMPSYLGDSIARWEGDTLVIETVGLPNKGRVRDFPAFIVGAGATVTERYTRISKDEMLYQYTVVDPAMYSAPWLAEYSLFRTDQRMFPYACHEGNYSLPNILSAQRVADARTTATIKP